MPLNKEDIKKKLIESKSSSIIEIRSSVLSNNLKKFKEILGSHSFAAPVLKSNAYGHGIDLITQLLISKNCKMLCVNDFNDGALVREQGFKERILVAGFLHKGLFDLAIKNQFEILISSSEELHEVIQTKNSLAVHLKFDIGLGRRGFDPSRVFEIIDYLKKKSFYPRGVAAHFSVNDPVFDKELALIQLEKFKNIKQAFMNAGFRDTEFHVASSFSALNLKDSHFDFIRLGLAFYGHWNNGLKLSGSKSDTALNWFSYVASIRKLKKGENLGYGKDATVKKDRLIAAIPVGYFDGYPRHLSKDAGVFIENQFFKLIGPVYMNMISVDITGSNVELGDSVLILGSADQVRIDPGELAAWSDIPVDQLLCGLRERIPRILSE